MTRMRKFQASFLLLVFFLAFFFTKIDFAQQVIPKEQSNITQAEKNHEKVVPSPKDIKESTAIYVFVVWMWLAILVLIYILRLKIKEVDRLYQIKYFSGKKK